MELIGLTTLALIVLGILSKPGIALMLAGFLAVVLGLTEMSLGETFGPIVGIVAVIGGTALIGLGRIIIIGESVVFHLRGLRRSSRKLAQRLHARLLRQ